MTVHDSRNGRQSGGLTPAAGRSRKPEAIWFGPHRTPLTGFLHRPEHFQGTGVLICAPFGYESTCAHRTLRYLADYLADRGELVLRFDYAGTGGSAGTGLEADLLDRWTASVSAGLAELRAQGVQRPALFGMRLGAALACAAAADDGNVGPLALWAPVTSGRRHYRELRAVAAATPGGAPGAGALNVFGHLVGGDAVRALKAWDPLRGLGPRAEVLVVQSPGARDGSAIKADFTAAAVHPTFREIDGTAAVLEKDAEQVKVPVPLVEAIAKWLVARSGGTVIRDGPRPPADGTRFVDGVIEEEIVAVPPAGLYGVLTRSAVEQATSGIIFLNNGVATAAGPGRAWVEFGRSLASEGVCALRMDFSGVGDSPDRTRRLARRENPVPPTAGHELIAAADYLRSRGVGHVVVVGLCSGAQVAVRTAAYAGAIDAVFAVNPPLYRLIDMGVGPWMRRLWKLTVFPLTKRPVRAAVHRLPERAWAVLDRWGVFPSPARYVRRAAQRGTSVHLIFGPGDKSLEDLQIRAGEAMDRLAAAGQLSVEVIDGLDHSMFDRARRTEVFERLRDVCRTNSATSPQALGCDARC